MTMNAENKRRKFITKGNHSHTKGEHDVYVKEAAGRKFLAMNVMMKITRNVISL